MQITDNFSLEEFTHSNTAIRQGIDNVPTQRHISNLIKLTREVLQPLRNLYAKTIKINSGYRSIMLNKAIGGAVNSQHLRGLASDITSVDNNKLFKLAKEFIDFDQLIAEDINSKGHPKWLHISTSNTKNRGQILIAVRTSKGMIYKHYTEKEYNRIYNT